MGYLDSSGFPKTVYTNSLKTILEPQNTTKTTISIHLTQVKVNKINSTLDQLTQNAANFTKANKTANNEYAAQIIKPQ